MSGIKGMKKYPQGIREKIVLEYNNGASQRELSRKYNISRYAIQCWLGTIQSKSILHKQRGSITSKSLQVYKY